MRSTTRKIRVVHFCNQLGIGGTERTMEIFCKHLDRERFEVFAVTRVQREPWLRRLNVAVGAAVGHAKARARRLAWSQRGARIPNFERILGADRIFYAQDDADLRRIIIELEPDVLHVHYSGRAESPTSDEEILSRVPVTVTTNQFEIENTASAHRRVKRMLFVSRWLLENKAPWAAKDSRAAVLYNPVEMPCDEGNLRAELAIPRDAFVVGRIGRADAGIHDPISLKAFAEIQDDRSYFVALSPPENMVEEARRLGIRNFIPLPPTADDRALSRFYNTIDVLAHARRDGETFGCNIAEAMIHGKPVVSHLTSFMNAQEEVIGDTGFVCAQDDWRSYAERLSLFRGDPVLRGDYAERASARAREHFEGRTLTGRLGRIYVDLL